MIYFEDLSVLEKCKSKRCIAEMLVSPLNGKKLCWRLCSIEDKKRFYSICNADTLEELQIWADLRGVNVIKS